MRSWLPKSPFPPGFLQTEGGARAPRQRSQPRRRYPLPPQPLPPPPLSFQAAPAPPAPPDSLPTPSRHRQLDGLPPSLYPPHAHLQLPPAGAAPTRSPRRPAPRPAPTRPGRSEEAVAAAGRGGAGPGAALLFPPPPPAPARPGLSSHSSVRAPRLQGGRRGAVSARVGESWAEGPGAGSPSGGRALVGTRRQRTISRGTQGCWGRGIEGVWEDRAGAGDPGVSASACLSLARSNPPGR